MNWRHIPFWLTKKTDYNLFAEEFSQTRKKPWAEMTAFQKIFQKEFTKSGKKPEILDIGCGNGRAFGLLEDVGAQVTGLDISANIINSAKNLHPGKNFVVSPMEKLPFLDRSFDAITSFASIPHLRTNHAREKTLSECFRVLRPGGVVYGTAWNLSQKQFKRAKKNAALRGVLPFWDTNDLVIPWGDKKIPRLYHRFTQKTLMKLLQKSGFEDIDIFSVVHGKKAPWNMGNNICFFAKKPKRIEVLSVPFDVLTFSEALTKFYEAAQSDTQTFATTPNPEICMLAKNNPAYRHVLSKADISIADGMGILWAADYLHSQKKGRFLSLLAFAFRQKSKFLPERICGSDMFRIFCQRTRQPVFLLGSTEEVCATCVKKFGNHIVGTDSGWSTPDDEARIVKKINDSGAKVLFVAFGAPKQEFWIDKNLKKLPNIRLAVGVGGSFDFIAGKQKRAPKIFRITGFEWLWRLLLEPRVRGKRILSAIWAFPKAVQEEKNYELRKTKVK